MNVLFNILLLFLLCCIGVILLKSPLKSIKLKKWLEDTFFGNDDTEKYQHVCPICGCTDLKSTFIISPVERLRPGAKRLQGLYKHHNLMFRFFGYWYFNGWQPTNPDVYICKDCDYYGVCVEVEINRVDYFKKNLKKPKIT